MFYMDKSGAMHMTKGDYVVFRPELKVEGTGEAYVLGAQDTLTFTVRALPDEGSAAISAYTSAPGSADIVIMPEDTAKAAPGVYSADLQINYDGHLPRTFWPEGNKVKVKGKAENFRNFVLEAEVG